MDTNVDQIQEEPTAQKRNVQITGESLPYKLNFWVDPNLPVIDFYAQAPISRQAIALANAAVRALSTYVNGLVRERKSPPLRESSSDRLVNRPPAWLMPGSGRSSAEQCLSLRSWPGVCWS